MKHYLYRHKNPTNGEIFYIGIGTKPSSYHNIEREYLRAYKPHSRGKFWNSMVKSLNGKFIVEILFESDDYDFIGEKEKEFIQLYGRRDLGLGPLVNLTDGGIGKTGAKNPHSEETKRKMSLASKNIPKSAKHRESLRQAKLLNPNKFWDGKSFSEEHKNKLSAAKVRLFNFKYTIDDNIFEVKLSGYDLRKSLGLNKKNFSELSKNGNFSNIKILEKFPD